MLNLSLYYTHIHIAEAVVGVPDLTSGTRQEVEPIRTLDCSYLFYASLIRSINHCSLIGVMCDTSIECYTGLYKYLNDSTQLNSTIREELLRIYWEELNELKIQSEIPIQLLIIIIIIFLIMILFGIFGSSLVIFIILNNRSMRTRGNLFILNLAISDLTLCLITQPFNLLRLLTNNYNWILGQFMCKFSAMFQGTNIFVSTFSITAIAIDRFQPQNRVLDLINILQIRRIFILTHELLLCDVSFLSYTLSINYYPTHSQPHLAKSSTNVFPILLVRCALSGWYINPPRLATNAQMSFSMLWCDIFCLVCI
ncbi:hypothetical protein MS3_00005833 [Schistosoma haematobium]|uniref:Uncharacterized protein n=1 Tax=Schistosoma haematobium TaxID=6185 RepID=A0A6A5DBJ6_SCHHA|nr:hypothetical protein MS3_00005833 [Schistosoma haematobium]KAH9588433.1 hypothetical protein MS3_00005833 [Schistosoma haematobium]